MSKKFFQPAQEFLVDFSSMGNLVIVKFGKEHQLFLRATVMNQFPDSPWWLGFVTFVPGLCPVRIKRIRVEKEEEVVQKLEVDEFMISRSKIVRDNEESCSRFRSAFRIESLRDLNGLKLTFEYEEGQSTGLDEALLIESRFEQKLDHIPRPFLVRRRALAQ
jgi:hypothetical protein